jgi:hypothetical protein
MIGRDLVKYHNYMHGPVHYTDSLSTFYTTPISAIIPGSSEDPQASQSSPFQGNMFIQGCISAVGWLDDDGTCTKLATTAITGCRPIGICGDHMQGPLHYSHQTLTDTPELTGYDFRNAEVNFDLDKDTFKTVVCDFTRPFSRTLHIAPTRIKPGCVSTLRIVVPPHATSTYIKTVFHPDLVWLNYRPTYVAKGFIAIISFESYGSRTADVVCAYREQCYEVCKPERCTLSGGTGFESFIGVETGAPSGSNITNQLTGCFQPLVFQPWVDDCNVTYTYTLTSSQSRSYLYNFKDYYTESGGTRRWRWTGETSDETGEPIGEWYYTDERTNIFMFRLTPVMVANQTTPPPSVLKIYRGNYSDRSSPVLPEECIYNSASALSPDDPFITRINNTDQYAVRFDRTYASQYMFTVEAPPPYVEVSGRLLVNCPKRYVASRYVPK